MAKLKVLHAIGNLSMGGAEVQCVRLINSLDSGLFDVSLAYFNDSSHADVAEQVRLCQVDRGSRFDLLGVCRQLREIMEDVQPDVVHVWLPEIISVPCAWIAYRLGIPVLSGHRKTFNYTGSINALIRDRLRCFQYFVADQVVSNFEISEEPILFRWLYGIKHGCVIPNGVDVLALRCVQALALPSSARYKLIYAGRLAPQKGIPIILRAMHELVQSGQDVHLTIFGEGPKLYESKLHSMVRELRLEGHVTFFGACRDWHAYAANAQALVLSTKGEGTSNTVLEALCVGLPVVISDIQMSRSLLRDQETASIVKSSEPSHWAAKIQALLEDPDLRHRIAENGRALSESYSMEHMISSYASLYRTITNIKPSIK